MLAYPRQASTRKAVPVTEDSRNLELLPSWTSKVERQIGVLVRQKIGQHEMLIALDSKDHARPHHLSPTAARIPWL